MTTELHERLHRCEQLRRDARELLVNACAEYNDYPDSGSFYREVRKAIAILEGDHPLPPTEPR